jgi:hypothetical protein
MSQPENSSVTPLNSSLTPLNIENKYAHKHHEDNFPSAGDQLAGCLHRKRHRTDYNPDVITSNGHTLRLFNTKCTMCGVQCAHTCNWKSLPDGTSCCRFDGCTQSDELLKELCECGYGIEYVEVDSDVGPVMAKCCKELACRHSMRNERTAHECTFPDPSRVTTATMNDPFTFPRCGYPGCRKPPNIQEWGKEETNVVCLVCFEPVCDLDMGVFVVPPPHDCDTAGHLRCLHEAMCNDQVCFVCHEPAFGVRPQLLDRPGFPDFLRVQLQETNQRIQTAVQAEFDKNAAVRDAERQAEEDVELARDFLVAQALDAEPDEPVDGNNFYFIGNVMFHFN